MSDPGHVHSDIDPIPGIDLTSADPAVRPEDDFYRARNGAWLETFDIPADKPEYGAFTALYDQSQEQLRAIIEELGIRTRKGDSSSLSADERKMATLYRDFMDTRNLDRLGLDPVRELLDHADSLTATGELPAVFGRFDRLGIGGPVESHVHQDNGDSTRYLLDLRQSGLGLPDRDYYLEPRHADTLAAYRLHVERMWSLAGFEHPTAASEGILELEMAIARIQWDSVRNRDPRATYNLLTVDAAEGLGASLRVRSLLGEIGAEGRVADLNIGQPDYFAGLSALLDEVPLERWRTWLRWRVLDGAAPLLSADFDEANFAFYGTALRGVPEQRPRWKRSIDVVQGAMGEALGRAYVARHFPHEHKERMTRLVDNILGAFGDAIDDLGWMGPETKARAHEKLATFRAKIGYPDVWRDYSALEIKSGDLVGNVLRANAFEHDRNMGKLGGPIDRDEWFMPPQVVNAYYNPEMNEIVFPAAILQPPFFDMDADDAVNYGAIGAVIGHEISHGFDDKGSQYDGAGNLHNWWTDSDREAFSDRTSALVAQYAAYEPVSGHPLNGELTLGENIADISGLAVALRAWGRSLQGSGAPVIGGMTGEQRLFASYAQVWRVKTRTEELVRRIAIDPHSPPEYRVNGALVNSSCFAEAFGVKPGDGMWRDPAERITIW